MSIKYHIRQVGILLFIGICILSGCNKNDVQFLKRNTKELNFSYISSSRTFTIRSTEKWWISDVPDGTSMTGTTGWVHVNKTEGEGEPDAYQTITVTCDANTASERTARLYLNSTSFKNVEISIFQENGIFEFATFDSGDKFDISGIIRKGIESNAYLRIPYIKATGEETFSFNITMTGGKGLSTQNKVYGTGSAGEGFIKIPITGIPYEQGAISFSLKMDDGTDFGTVSSIVRDGFDNSGNEIFLVSQNFDLFPWGGDCIGKQAGVTTVITDQSAMTLNDETKTCSAGNNAGIGGITSTIRTKNPTLYEAIGMTGWTGYLNYMCPGYMQLGAATANSDGQPGNLISPSFEIPEGCNDLLLTFQIAKWTDSPDQVMGGLCEKHDGIWMNKYPENFTKKTKNIQYASLDIPSYKWVDVTMVVPVNGSLQEGAIYISTADSWWDSNYIVKAGRWYVDNIKLAY